MKHFGQYFLRSFSGLVVGDVSHFFSPSVLNIQREFHAAGTLCEENPYEVLGLDNDCTIDEIKKRFKQLAKKYHPDVSKEDNAKEKFQEINNAYQILSDEEKRQAYDSFGTTDNTYGNSDFDFGGADFSSTIFEDLFQGFGFDPFSGFGQSSNRGGDVYYGMEVDLEEIVYGGSRTIELDKPVKCGDCEGSGEEANSIHICTTCDGMGFQTVKQMGFMMQMGCQTCGGKGEMSSPCNSCEGSGYESEKQRKKVKIKIPVGADDGYIIKLDGYGEMGFRGGEPGDLYIEIMILPKSKFKRKNEKDITSIVEIGMIEALLGGPKTVKNVKGEERVITIPPNTQYGDEVVLKGEGVQKSKFFSKSGDLIFKLKVTLPKYSLSNKQKELLEEFLEEEKKKE